MPSIAVVGTQGCGKTVFITVLAKSLAVMDENGVFLRPRGAREIQYVEENWHALQNGEWPPSTRPGEMFDLQWTFKAGRGVEYDVRLVDAAGQDLRQIFMIDIADESNVPNMLKPLAHYCHSAEIVLFMLNLKDFVGEGDPQQRIANQTALYEAMGFLKKNHRQCCILFTQSDQYREIVNEHGGWMEFARTQIPYIYGAYMADGSIPVFTVSAVNRTDVRVGPNGGPLIVPGRGFESEGLKDVLHWLTEKAKLMPSERPAEASAPQIVDGTIEQYQRHVRSACQLFKASKYDEAEKEADKALALVPGGSNAVEVKSVAKSHTDKSAQGGCSVGCFVISIIGIVYTSTPAATGYSTFWIIVLLSSFVAGIASLFQSPKKDLTQAALPNEIALDLGDGVILPLVPIEAGTFLMGSPNARQWADERGETISNEKPHSVTLTKRFYMSKYPVTQEQYKALIGGNPSKFTSGNNSAQRPVERVSWNDAEKFCAKLVEKSGKDVQLPTEAQWEYACRARTTTSYYFGVDETSIDDHAWSKGNSGNKTHQIGEKKPNAFGLFDIHGNVWEWCRDGYFEDYELLPTDDPIGVNSAAKVVRGGSWFSDAKICRSAYRNSLAPDTCRDNVGFRVVVEVDGNRPTVLPNAG